MDGAHPKGSLSFLVGTAYAIFADHRRTIVAAWADNIASAFASVDLEVIRRGQDPPEHPSAPLLL